MDGQLAGSATLAPKQTGAIESRLPYFDGNINSLNCIANQLEQIITRINGPEPCSEGLCKETTPPDGVLQKLDEITSGTGAATERIGRAVDKLCELI